MFDENATETIFVDGYTCSVLKRRNGDGRMAQSNMTRTVGLRSREAATAVCSTAGVLDVGWSTV